MSFKPLTWLACAGLAVGLAGCEVDIDDEREPGRVRDVEIRDDRDNGHIHRDEKIERNIEIERRDQEPAPRDPAPQDGDRDL